VESFKLFDWPICLGWRNEAKCSARSNSAG